MPQELILYPILIMVAWVAIVWLLMVVYTMRDVKTLRIKAEDARHTADLMPRWSGIHRCLRENYNHLHEQPTSFYALVLVIFGLGHVDAIHLALAWGFVGLRIVHSIVQVWSQVLYRLALFSITWLILMVMIARELYSLLA